MDWLSLDLNIKKMDDWKQVSPYQINSSLLEKEGGLIRLLSNYLDSKNNNNNNNSNNDNATSTLLAWNRSAYTTSGNISKFQASIYKILNNNNSNSKNQIFPHEEDIRLNYIHPQLTYDSTGKHMQLDIFLPRLNLVVEAQGIQHYKWTNRYGDHKNQEVISNGIDGIVYLISGF